MIALEEKLSDDEIKPKNLALVGRSAGAYLAMRYGYTHYKESLTPSPIDISHIVADVGPTDTTDTDILDLWSAPSGFGQAVYMFLSVLAGVEVTALDDLTTVPELVAASLSSCVTLNAPPTLLRYAGALDNMVPASHGTVLKNALEAAGHEKHHLFEFPESPHDLDFNGIPNGISDEELDRYQDYWTTYDWYFNEYMD